ncbi:patatin-like phospholipase family protein [Endothiovibrio diazotrophicus]
MGYNILALDGGTRPLLAVGILEQLESRCPGFLDAVDLFAGTSAGAITCAFIAFAPTLRDGLQRAREFWSSPQSFQVDPLRSLTALAGTHAFSDQAKIKAALERHFGDATLGDLKCSVLIPSFCLDNKSAVAESRGWTVRLIHTLDPVIADTDLKVVDALLRSGSSPVVNPVYQGYADGGLFANNPSLCAVTSALDYVGERLEAMRVVSVGHGRSQKFIDCDRTTDFGYHKWLLDPTHPMALLKVVMDSNRQAVTYQCSRLLEDRFMRIDPSLAAGTDATGINFDRYVLALDRAARALDYLPHVRQLNSMKWVDAGRADG